MYEVNRSVFLLVPLDPFWNWLQSLPGNHLAPITACETYAATVLAGLGQLEE